MEHTEYKVDREGWPAGPWDNEPDRFEFEHAGHTCMLIRNQFGVWCGYVGVPPGHPLYEKSYWHCNLGVHGGLTYSNKCFGHICHTPKPGEPDDIWWLGFDCVHGSDLVPCTQDYAVEMGLVYWSSPGQEYRTVEYAKDQTEKLAEQIADATGTVKSDN